MNTNSTQTSTSILSEKYFCGIDLASKVIQVSVTRPNVESYDLSLKIKDFDEFIKKHCSDNYIYAMEACGNSNYAYNVKKDLPFHKNGIMHLFEGSCRFHQKDQICDAA